jgi:hypothetical protein
MSDMAFVAVLTDDGHYGLGIAKLGSSGYLPQRNKFAYPLSDFCADLMSDDGWFKTWEVATQIADELNEKVFKLNRDAAFIIVASSMRGST